MGLQAHMGLPNRCKLLLLGDGGFIPKRIKAKHLLHLLVNGGLYQRIA